MGYVTIAIGWPRPCCRLDLMVGIEGLAVESILGLGHIVVVVVGN
jgi:hypothetical protein